MMRKLEKQAIAQATKEAKKQQGKQLLFTQTPLIQIKSYVQNLFLWIFQQ